MDRADTDANGSSQQSEAAALEEHIRAVTEAIERSVALLRALPPLRSQLAALDAAVAALGIGAAPPAVGAEAPASSADTAALNRMSVVSDRSEWQPPVGDAERVDSPTPSEQGVARTSDSPNELSASGPVSAPRAGGTANGNNLATIARISRTATVTVTRDDAPLDLVRVHSALDRVQGVMSLALVSYTRGRAVLQVEADRPIDELELAQGLRDAFPEGVTTQRQSPDDVVIAIGPR